MSIHFAPQWVKPIKPPGSHLSSSDPAAGPKSASAAAAPAASSSPFPALSAPRSGSPTVATSGAGAGAPGASAMASGNPPLSYSRVTHKPASPTPEYYYAEGGADASPSPYPFRYSREEILAVWDEDKVRERPIELLQLADSGAVIVSQSVVKPVGLRDLSELEKKLLATSVHPPMPNRRPQQTHGIANNNDPASPMRRQQPGGGGGGGKDSVASSPVTARAPFGGFGRGEGGVFGGAKFSGALADASSSGGGGGGGGGVGRQPGSLGGGFGGVGKRTNRRDAGGDDHHGQHQHHHGHHQQHQNQHQQQQQQQQPRSATATTWRNARNQSGTFEGVLGFGNNAAAAPGAAEQQSNAKPDDDSWGAGQRKWRATADDKPEAVEPAAHDPAAAFESHHEATPVGHAPAPSSQTPQPQDLGAINWFYRDPNGQEQGPFTGNQMHEWYSHSYFKDDLPVRREKETSFHTLSELKSTTGNAVQPFLSVVRPRLPPNLPIPLSALQAAPGAPSPTLDSFHRLNIHGSPHPQPQQAYGHPNFNNNFQSGFNGVGGSPYQQPQGGWNPAPGPQTPGRSNSAFGLIGGQQYPAYGPAIGSRGPDMFAPSTIGQPSNTWGVPSSSWQPQVGAPLHAPVPQQMPIPEQQYLPQQPQQQVLQPQQPQQVSPEVPQVPEQAEPEPEFDAAAHHFDTESEAVDEPEAEVESEVYDEELVDEALLYEEEEEEIVAEVEAEAEAEPEAEAVADPSPVKPAQSAWATPAKSSRKQSSSSTSAPTPAQASKLPPPPASLPARPAAAAEPATSATPTTPTVERSTPKPAPWADKLTAATGPSLREIQEAESRQAEARKLARAEARATASPAPTSDEHVGSTLSWGLPQQGKSTAAVSAAASPVATSAAPAWGGSADGPKKTLKQIQEEEERRKHKQEAQVRAASAAAGAGAAATQKRGYADLAAHSTPSAAQAAQAAAAGWTTVGAAGKVAASPAKAAAPAPVAKTVVQAAKAAVSSAPTVPKPIKANGSSDDPSQPSVEFIRWTKQSLTGLEVPVDDFIQMLLQFPIDPPASSRGDVLEIISDSVYASSSTLDGRWFAQEFFTRRKADAQRNATATRPTAKVTSLADVVKTQPKAPSADLGFKVVKTKKNRRG